MRYIKDKSVNDKIKIRTWNVRHKIFKRYRPTEQWYPRAKYTLHRICSLRDIDSIWKKDRISSSIKFPSTGYIKAFLQPTLTRFKMSSGESIHSFRIFRNAGNIFLSTFLNVSSNKNKIPLYYYLSIWICPRFFSRESIPPIS